MTRKKKPSRLGESAYALIRADILRCDIEPGSAVTEASLAARYELGKAPIRSALQRLAQEGLVTSVPRRGHIVSPITLRDVHELFEFRLLLEPATARKAAAVATDAEVRALRQLLQQDLQLGTNFNEANTKFHLLIARIAGNGRVAGAISELQDQMERIFNVRPAPESVERLQSEHERIIDALERRDPDAAERAAADHIQTALSDVLSAVHRSDALLAVELHRR